jgi:protoporphyrinogen oxidase
MLKHSLSDYYVTNITDDTPFTGIIEMTAIVDKEEFNGNALVYLPRYVAPDDKLFDMTDDEIEEYFLGALEEMYPLFKRTDVVTFKVSKVRQVFPIPVVDYSTELSDMKSSVDGVHIVNSSHIVNGTLNINETVQLAERFFREDTAGK